MTLIAEHQDAVIKGLLEEVAELRKRVESLESQFARIPENILYEIVEIRDIGKEEARAEIVDLFATGETLYYSDIADRLLLDYEMVIEICRELESEGAIGVDDDAV